MIIKAYTGDKTSVFYFLEFNEASIILAVYESLRQLAYQDHGQNYTNDPAFYRIWNF